MYPRSSASGAADKLAVNRRRELNEHGPRNDLSECAFSHLPPPSTPVHATIAPTMAVGEKSPTLLLGDLPKTMARIRRLVREHPHDRELQRLLHHLLTTM